MFIDSKMGPSSVQQRHRAFVAKGLAEVTPLKILRRHQPPPQPTRSQSLLGPEAGADQREVSPCWDQRRVPTKDAFDSFLSPRVASGASATASDPNSPGGHCVRLRGDHWSFRDESQVSVHSLGPIAGVKWIHHSCQLFHGISPLARSRCWVYCVRFTIEALILAGRET
jgi:hypothetical protein